jgi:hypothetical protein
MKEEAVASPNKVFHVRWWIAMTQPMANAVADQALIQGVTRQAILRRAVAEYLDRQRDKKSAA